MTKKIKIEEIAYYRNAEGDIRGDIDLRRDWILCSESFGIYASGNWEFKGWENRRYYSKRQKKAIEAAIIAKVV